jgi:hypothetical protein
MGYLLLLEYAQLIQDRSIKRPRLAWVENVVNALTKAKSEDMEENLNNREDKASVIEQAMVLKLLSQGLSKISIFFMLCTHKPQGFLLFFLSSL